jgi:hypothetical protein
MDTASVQEGESPARIKHVNPSGTTTAHLHWCCEDERLPIVLPSFGTDSPALHGRVTRPALAGIAGRELASPDWGERGLCPNTGT